MKNNQVLDTIEIDKSKKNFFYSYDMIFDLDISCHAKCLYMYLCRCADSNSLCFPSIKKIANKCGISERTVHRAIKELMLFGLIVKYTSKEGKGSNRYVVYSEPDNEVFRKNLELGNITEDDLPENLNIYHFDSVTNIADTTTTSSSDTQTVQDIGGVRVAGGNDTTTTSSSDTQTVQDIGVSEWQGCQSGRGRGVRVAHEGIYKYKEYISTLINKIKRPPCDYELSDEDLSLLNIISDSFSELFDVYDSLEERTVYKIPNSCSKKKEFTKQELYEIFQKIVLDKELGIKICVNNLKYDKKIDTNSYDKDVVLGNILLIPRFYSDYTGYIRDINGNLII